MKINQFEGQRIWLIGASAGIGEALAYYLDGHGAQLILSSRRESSLQRVADKLKQPAHIVAFDVGDAEQFAKAFQAVSAQRIDRIIYLPAMYQPMLTGQLERSAVEATVQQNLTAVFYLLEFALPYLQKNTTCQLAVTASVAGYSGLPKAQPYGATKAAVINLIESVKAEHPQADIKLMNPGFVKTRLTDKNDFKMPMLQTPEQAAQAIAKGLLSKCFEIHFPKLFTRVLKLLRWLPYRLYFVLVRQDNNN